ncbi:MAG: tRNA (N6-isopentenyl adenosine(37)-C2)-methylthiotransferase MiaB [Clostridiales bacterium]|nr:tRNA (N6-isopentenyl adenosine(37)-C2)-methylthiotransferase MiaB [Clostridiales bacterium]
MTRTISHEELKTQQRFSDAVADIFSRREENPLAYVHSFGCQQNVSDGEKIKGMLAQMGYGFTDDVDKADLVLFNTCAVRENAEDRVFGNVGALKHKKRRNPNMIIAVCGCMVQQEHITQRLYQSFPFVDIIFGTHVLHTLPSIIYQKLSSGKRQVLIPEENGSIAEGVPVQRDSKFKAWVPIMYGCNNFCTFCIVPHVRGRERSRLPRDIIKEVSDLVKEGYKDITLLGQNVNSYGKELGISFAELLKTLDEIEGEYKLGFMTSHPKDCTRELIDVIANGKHISRHLHLPVQSGSDRVLKAMNRRYTVEKYMDIINYAKEKIDEVALTSDIIVGFPGETYEEFLQTIELIKKVEYDSLFTFIYSPRKGTKAADMPDPITREEKGKWFEELLQVQSEASAHSYDKFVGRTLRVLCDGVGKSRDNLLTGRTIHNIIVEFEGDKSLVGSFVDVKITSALNWAMVGEMV